MKETAPADKSVMRSVIYQSFLSVFFIVLTALTANAQAPGGSFGDPVINENFGQGSNPGMTLPSGVTTMSYTTDPCPGDGFYTIVNSLDIKCHTTWQNVPKDHTGNPNGYMMLINASTTPDVFYVQQANGLCPGTTYQFGAWILNLITAAAATGSTSEPDITFSIEAPNGDILATYNTGTIAPTSSPTWVQYSLLFTTPPNVTDVTVRMKNNAPGGSGNDLILDDITFSPYGPILQAGFGSATGATTQPLCAGQSANYTLQAADAKGLSTPAYQWQENINRAGWNDLPGQTTTTLNLPFTNAVAGVYQYRYGAVELLNIGSPACRVYSNPVEVDVNPLPVVTVTAPQSVCEGGTVQLLASGGASYQWSGPNLPLTISQNNPLVINNITPADAGNYTVIATSAQGCTATTATTVMVFPKVTATVSSDATICQGQSTNLSAAGGTTYLWSPSTGLSDIHSASPVANPTETTAYTVTVTNANGCLDTKTVTVNVLKKPVANAGSKKIIFEGQSVKLDGSAMGSISSVYWTPADHLDNPNSLTPVANPVNDITYTLHVLSNDNCGSDTSSVFVRVYKEIVIPNTFSPNKDGTNDFWNIDALITYPNCLVTIFNRYGQQVYKSTGYSTPWNGNYSGSPVPVGTYYYVIDLKIGTPKLRGWIMVVR